MSKQAALAAIADHGGVLEENGIEELDCTIHAPEGWVWASSGEHQIELEWRGTRDEGWRHVLEQVLPGLRQCGGRCRECTV